MKFVPGTQPAEFLKVLTSSPIPQINCETACHLLNSQFAMAELGDAGNAEREQKERERAKELRGAVIALTIGYSIVAPIIGGPIVGWFLDQQFGTSPWLFIILMIGGIYGGLSMAVRLAGKL